MELSIQNSVLLCRDSLVSCASLWLLHVPLLQRHAAGLLFGKCFLLPYPLLKRTVLSQICSNTATSSFSSQQETGCEVFVKLFHCVYVHAFCILEGL